MVVQMYNTPPLSQCKDSSLTAESFAAAISEGSCSDERLELASRVHTEIEHLKKTGVTGMYVYSKRLESRVLQKACW